MVNYVDISIECSYTMRRCGGWLRDYPPFLLVVLVVSKVYVMSGSLQRHTSIGNWINRAMARNGLKENYVARKVGIHPNTLSAYIKDETPPKLPNLCAIVEIIALAEDRSPTQLLFEACTHLREMKYAEERWKKRRDR